MLYSKLGPLYLYQACTGYELHYCSGSPWSDFIYSWIDIVEMGWEPVMEGNNENVLEQYIILIPEWESMVDN